MQHIEHRRMSRRALQERLRETDAVLQRMMEEMKALQGLAFSDALTGLANRRALDERLQQELSRAQRRPDRAFSVLIIDLDGFKQVNDQLGHAAGDQVLMRFARFLTGHLRTHDVVARTGGDEFMVLLPDTCGAECAGAVQRLRKAFEGFEIGCSIGGASWPGDGYSVNALMIEADQAMYADKRRRERKVA